MTALEQSAELLISGLKNCVSKIASIDITSYESNSFYQDAEVYAQCCQLKIKKVLDKVNKKCCAAIDYRLIDCEVHLWVI